MFLTSYGGRLFLYRGEQAIGIVRHDAIDSGTGKQAHVRRVVNGPANHLEVTFVSFSQEIGSNKVSPHSNLARPDRQGLGESIFGLMVKEKPGHQRRLKPSESFENAGVKRNDDDTSDLAGIAKSADERVFSSPETIGFQLEVENDIVLARELQDFQEGGDALPHEFTAKPGSGVEATNLGKGHSLDGALTGGGAVDGFVMQGYEVGVAREVKISLNERNAQRDSAAKRGQGVLRGVSGSTTMSNGMHERKDLHGGSRKVNFLAARAIPCRMLTP
jgi:hypothetical protein